MDRMHNYQFPKSYMPWLKELLTDSIHETLVNCNDCSMVNPQGETRDPGPFRPDLKCCTYFPFLPNFTLGSMECASLNRARSGIYLPVGLYPPISYLDLSERLGKKGFGQEPKLLCPFFDRAKLGCSIWDFRPGVCTTYFCKSVRGSAGLAHWQDVEEFLNQFEWKMATEVFFRMGMSENELSYCQTAISPDTPVDEFDFVVRAAWGDWFHRQVEFYKNATEIALQMSVDEVKKMMHL